MMEDTTVAAIIYLSGLLGLIFAFYNVKQTTLARNTKYTAYSNEPGQVRASMSLNGGAEAKSQPLLDGVGGDKADQEAFRLSAIISNGARTFLQQEYRYLALTMGSFAVVIFVVLATVLKNMDRAIFASIAYIVGGITSAASGYIGMEIATYANVATTIAAKTGYGQAFRVAYRAGGVMGFSLVGLGLINLFTVIILFGLKWPNAGSEGHQNETIALFEAVAGFGLGGATVALFGRVGGGIYTKAADVGADLVGKKEYGLEEDDPKNPAVIADNVGDNVGDIAGMGADLFGSFGSSCCATMLIAAQSEQLSASRASMVLPLIVYGIGLLVCFLVSFVATHITLVEVKEQIEKTLHSQVMLTTIAMTPVIYGLCVTILPEEFFVKSIEEPVRPWHIAMCLWAGLWSGLVMGTVTEYYTSSKHFPVQELADSTKTGAATNIIYGLALGYKSVCIPVLTVTLGILTNFYLAGEYGVAMGAVGILSTLATELAIDAYGPICDNAGGIAEMAHFPSTVSDYLDDLDAAGNTTAAVGKGFAIGSATYVSLALFGAFVTSAELEHIEIQDNLTFAGLLVGAMLPYLFTAMTMKSVGMAAYEMVEEVRRQLEGPDKDAIFAGTKDPDYDKCIAISTDASLREMVMPGLLTILTPLFVGFFISPRCLAGLLAGNLISGVQMAISQSNTGGAWDNAKKYIEAGNLGPGKGKGSDEHNAAIIGDTVGDPLKDTSGPAINILIKVTAILSVVFAPAMSEDGLFVKVFELIRGE